MKNCKPIVPAVIPDSQDEVISFSKTLSFSPEYHLDLVDGKFVAATSWPFEPLGDPVAVKKYLDPYTLEVDLMVEEPVKVAIDWLRAGADMLVFHVETLSLEEFKNFAESHSISIGISGHGDTTLETLAEYAEHADYIQLMGIHEIGAQGLPFDEKVLDKITDLKRRFPLKSITIDGSVNSDTIARLAKAGADRFICGSAIVKQDDPEAAHAALSALIND
jgi:ribulose-phosphate 3-epimerase